MQWQDYENISWEDIHIFLITMENPPVILINSMMCFPGEYFSMAQFGEILLQMSL